MPLKNAKWIISTLPQHETEITHEDPRYVLLEGLRRQGFSGKVGISTQVADEIANLKNKGADFVFRPYNDAAKALTEIILSTDPLNKKSA